MLTEVLGSTNPRLTTHCRGTLALTAVGILTRLWCYYRRDLHFDSVHWASRPSFSPSRTPSYQRHYRIMYSRVSVASLSPVHFRGLASRPVSCYAFFKGWLLLSLPPGCLRYKTPFGLTLSWHLGTLTPVWVAPLSVHELNPWNPTLLFSGAYRFGV